jgi:hypothetical protein
VLARSTDRTWTNELEEQPALPLIESAKLCGVEPRAYLGEATRRAIRNRGTISLPRDLK